MQRARPALLASLVLAAIPVIGCGSSSHTLSAAAIERAIEQSILAQRNVRTTVSCPSNVPREKGRVFSCTASLNVGRYPVTVIETDASGHVHYENKTRLVALKIGGVERAIRLSILSQRHLSSTVACPQEVLQQAGLSFICTATVHGRGSPFEVTETDGRGHVRYVGR